MKKLLITALLAAFTVPMTFAQAPAQDSATTTKKPKKQKKAKKSKKGEAPASQFAPTK